jgi:hypothetical protein
MSGTGGVAKRLGVLRVQYYCVMGAVAAAVVLATLRYMPGPAATSSGAAPGEAGAASLGGRKRMEDAPAPAREKDDDGVVLFNFGDSNSDTGGVAAVMGIRIAPPEGRAYFRRPTGRLSDGRVVLDFICEFRHSSALLLFGLVPPTSNPPRPSSSTSSVSSAIPLLCCCLVWFLPPAILLARPHTNLLPADNGQETDAAKLVEVDKAKLLDS